MWCRPRDSRRPGWRRETGGGGRRGRGVAGCGRGGRKGSWAELKRGRVHHEECRVSCEAVELARAASVAVGRLGTCRIPPRAVAVSRALKEEVACHAAVPAVVREHGRCALRERGGAARHAVRVWVVHVHVARAAAANNLCVGGTSISWPQWHVTNEGLALTRARAADARAASTGASTVDRARIEEIVETGWGARTPSTVGDPDLARIASPRGA